MVWFCRYEFWTVWFLTTFFKAVLTTTYFSLPNIINREKLFICFQIQLNLHLSTQLFQDDILKSTKLQMYR